MDQRRSIQVQLHAIAVVPWRALGSCAMRVTSRPLNAYPWYLRLFFWNQRRRYGAVLAPALLWARVPRLFLAVALFYGAIERRTSPLSRVLRLLVMVRVSQLNGCSFCVDLNTATLIGCGIALQKAQALHTWRESDLFDESERVALDYAEAMTLCERQVDDELMERARDHFDEQMTMELTALIAFQNMSSKFNSALDVPSQGFCELPSGTTIPTHP